MSETLKHSLGTIGGLLGALLGVHGTCRGPHLHPMIFEACRVPKALGSTPISKTHYMDRLTAAARFRLQPTEGSLHEALASPEILSLRGGFGIRTYIGTCKFGD